MRRRRRMYEGGFSRGTALALCTLMGLLASGCIGPMAVAGERVINAYDVAALRSVSDVAISPDGSLAAYVLSVPRQPWKKVDEDAGEEAEKDGQSWAELHVVDRGGRSRPFITGHVNISGIDWTPDGKGIAFLAKRGEDKNTCLYVIPIDGGEGRRLLKHEADVGSYSFSPDGKRVAYLAGVKEDKKAKKRKDKGFNQEVYEEEWKPTKVWIASIGATQGKPKALELPGSASELHWSPAGNLLAVALAPTSMVDDSYMNRRVHVMDAETGEVKAKIQNPGKLGQVAWSPDGKMLAMISAADLNDPSEGRLMVVPATGGFLKDLLPDLQGHVQSIAWQDANTIMYVADEGVSSMFGKVGLDGSQKTILPVGGMVLTRMSLSRDGLKAAFLSHHPTHPAEVFMMGHGERGPTRVTQSNPQMSEYPLAKQEIVRYKARDGMEIEGLLMRPLNETPGQRYPTIVVVHGGPEAHFSNGWVTRYSDPGQVAAAHGYAVFYPNYRGSTGRGVAFSKAGQRDFGGKEFDDLVDGVEYLVNLGITDKAKVGITGGSYGGYASAWCATYYSERFAAAVMFVGISDQISKFGTTDIPQEMYHVHELGWPWDSWEKFRERSPITHVAKAKTPILIMHGKNDPRVHPSQSMELYRYIKSYGDTPVRLVWYVGEGHGNRKASAKLDYNLRMMEWFDHYLKGPGGAPPKWELGYEWESAEEGDKSKK